MKKDMIRAIVVATVVFVIYNMIAFLIPFVQNETFWISYGFTVVALVLVLVSMYIAFLKNLDAKSRFYGFPIARIAAIYGVVQVIASLAIMAVAQWMIWWGAMLAYAIGMCVAAIGLISAEAVADEIKTLDTKLKKDVSLMRYLQTNVSQIAAQSDEPAIRALAEEFRYSDPVSNNAIADAEADLSAAVNELQVAFVDGDREAVVQMCKKASALLAERNRLCKLNK